MPVESLADTESGRMQGAAASDRASLLPSRIPTRALSTSYERCRRCGRARVSARAAVRRASCIAAARAVTLYSPLQSPYKSD